MNGITTLRPKRPQLNDAIDRLDQMVEGLEKTIPAAVAGAVKDALGPAFAAAVKGAVTAAVAEAVKEAVRELAAVATPPATSPTVAPPAPPGTPKPGPWARVKGTLGHLRRWAGGKAAPVVTRLAIGWAVMRAIGTSTVHSRAAVLTTAATGAAAGLLGFAAGPVASAVLLGLTAGAVAAAATWAAPAAALLTLGRED